MTGECQNRQLPEVHFYESFFESVSFWATDVEEIIKLAYQESCQFGLGAMDALHIAAAISIGATEFITHEKVGRSIYRTSSIKILSTRR